jgi:hypothetical protein
MPTRSDRGSGVGAGVIIRADRRRCEPVWHPTTPAATGVRPALTDMNVR